MYLRSILADQVDVLIVTALKLELDAVLACPIPGSEWQPYEAGAYTYQIRTLSRSGGAPPLRVAAARATEMGEVAAAACAVRLIDLLNPPTLAMSGVCAGREGAVELGDVIVAERLYKYDSGAAISSARDADLYSVNLVADVRTYSLPLTWRQALESISPEWTTYIAQPGPVPVPVAEQARWVAALLAADESRTLREVFAHPERKLRAPDWEGALQRLERLHWLKLDWSGLSEEGQKHGRRELAMYPDGRMVERKPKLRIGAIATGARVQRDIRLFDRLDAVTRRTLGVEMEGVALAAVAEIHETRAIMAKGVMDFADPDKDDAFKEYAARAAAAFLLTFLRDNAPAAQSRPANLARTKRTSARRASVAAASAQAAVSLSACYVQLRACHPLEWVASAVRSGGCPDAEVECVPGADEATYLVTSSAEQIDRLINAYRFGQFRGVDFVPVDYVGRVISEHDPDDPVAGKFGCLPRRAGRRLTASVTPSSKDWFECDVRVSAADIDQALPKRVLLQLHPTLAPGPIEVQVIRGVAHLSFEAWGSFTVGAELPEADGSSIKLELNLANLPDVPRGFIDE